MADIETGGPAFPWCGDLNETPFIALGMNLRDYFAAKALPSIILCLFRQADDCGRDAPDDMLYAMQAYDLADAMLRAREAK